MWLRLEVGTARSLSRRARALRDLGNLDDPRWRGRRSLVVEAAHTCLPEAAVEDLPAVARAEISAGLTGRLRSTIAEAEEDDPSLPLLRDQLLSRLGGTAGGIGALGVLDRVYAGRLLRELVPPIIMAGCVTWYGQWRGSCGGPSLLVAESLRRAMEAWLDQPRRRSELDAVIIANARRLAGDCPVALEDVAA